MFTMLHQGAQSMRWMFGAIARSVALGALLLCLLAGCAGASSTARSGSPTAAARAGSLSPSSYVTTDGTRFLFHGQPLKLNGYTFYPAPIGGTSAWDRPSFTTYIDHMLDMGLSAGQNLARPTDYWDKTNTQQTWNDPVIWSNMDYLVHAAQKRGVFVMMDLSAYKWLLMSHGQDPNDAANWTAFLDFVGARYSGATSIAAYTIVGEPSPPHSATETVQLVDFYRSVTDELYRADGGRHLIAAGGFNHMEDETPQTQWWQQIDALPHNDIVAFKTYSQHDLNLMPAIAAYARGIHKPLMVEEFGLPQSMGDGASTGEVYNGLQTSRAAFFQSVYDEGSGLGVSSFIFWNLGCQIGDQSYEVSPRTAGVWQVVTQHGAVPAVAWPTSVAIC